MKFSQRGIQFLVTCASVGTMLTQPAHAADSEAEEFCHDTFCKPPECIKWSDRLGAGAGRRSTCSRTCGQSLKRNLLLSQDGGSQELLLES